VSLSKRQLGKDDVKAASTFGAFCEGHPTHTLSGHRGSWEGGQPRACLHSWGNRYKGRGVYSPGFSNASYSPEIAVGSQGTCPDALAMTILRPIRILLHALLVRPLQPCNIVHFAELRHHLVGHGCHPLGPHSLSNPLHEEQGYIKYLERPSSFPW